MKPLAGVSRAAVTFRLSGWRAYPAPIRDRLAVYVWQQHELRVERELADRRTTTQSALPMRAAPERGPRHHRDGRSLRTLDPSHLRLGGGQQRWPATHTNKLQPPQSDRMPLLGVWRVRYQRLRQRRLDRVLQGHPRPTSGVASRPPRIPSSKNSRTAARSLEQLPAER